MKKHLIDQLKLRKILIMQEIDAIDSLLKLYGEIKPEPPATIEQGTEEHNDLPF